MKLDDIVLALGIEERLKRSERLPHRAHQLDGVLALIAHDKFALFDEVGAGKTKQVIDAAQFLFQMDQVDTVLVIAPGFARSTWAEEDPLLGEVAKHAWETVANVIHEYHAKYDELLWETDALNWVVSNYEFVRREERLHDLLKQLRGRKTWLVLDEAWAVKNHKSDQSRACFHLRYKRAERVTILNGTPLADGSPKDLYSQMAMLDKGILGVKNFTHFKARYAVMGGYLNKKIVEWVHLDELNAKVAPHILTRRTRDCFDLPPMLDPILVEAKLTDPTWRIYREMRDDLVAWLEGEQKASVAKQAVVRALRLAQITSGYLGGFEENMEQELGRPDWLGPTSGPPDATVATKELSSEKLDAMIDWLEEQPRQQKLLVWCRFRLELNRACDRIGEKLRYPCFKLQGGQRPEERAEAKRALAPDGDDKEAAVVGNQGAGGASINLAGASMAIYLSNDFSLLKRTQSIGRIERPGQRGPMRVVDVVATGPKGQKTIDHQILKALRSKDDMARWTVARWREIVEAE